MEGSDEPRVVREWLAHAHEDDIGQAGRTVADLSARSRTRGRRDLFDDLSGGEISGEAALTGRAERAGHPAASLAGDADGGAVGADLLTVDNHRGVPHQDTLDERAVV